MKNKNKKDKQPLRKIGFGRASSSSSKTFAALYDAKKGSLIQPKTEMAVSPTPTLTPTKRSISPTPIIEKIKLTPNQGIHIKEVTSTRGTIYGSRDLNIKLRKLNNDGYENERDVLIFSPIKDNSAQQAYNDVAKRNRTSASSQQNYNSIAQRNIDSATVKECVQQLEFDDYKTTGAIQIPNGLPNSKKRSKTQNAVKGHPAREQFKDLIEIVASSQIENKAELINFLSLYSHDTCRAEWSHLLAHSYNIPSLQENPSANLKATTCITNTMMMPIEIVTKALAINPDLSVTAETLYSEITGTEVIKDIKQQMSIHSNGVNLQLTATIDNIAIPEHHALPKAYDPEKIYQVLKSLLKQDSDYEEVMLPKCGESLDECNEVTEEYDTGTKEASATKKRRLTFS